MLTVDVVDYSVWGKCARISNGEIELFATLDCGPRIIRAGFMGAHNFMFEDVGRTRTNDVGDYFSGDDTFYLMGGHRFWTSPEALPRSYYPENEPIDYEILNNGIILKPKAQEKNFIQYEIEINMNDEGKCTIIHRATNVGAWPVEFAPWALTVLAQGGEEIIPIPDAQTGLLSNCSISLWSYTKMNDERVHWGDKYITLKQDTNASGPFKLGINSQHGYAAYFLKDAMFLKRFKPNYPNGSYPDNGMSFESYTDKDFIEMETLGELKMTAVGETVAHIENWEFYNNVKAPANEKEITKTLEKYL